MPAAPQSVVRRRKTGKAMIKGDRELIDAYLQGTLSPAERLVFETRLQTDTVLKKETEAVALVLPMIQLAGRMHLKTKLRSIEATLPASLADYTPAQNNKGKLKAKGKFSLKWWWVAVAVGIIAAAIAWYVFFNHASPEKEGECLDCTEQTESGQPAADENALRRIADSLYADSCRKDSLRNSAAVSLDVNNPAASPFGESARGSKPKSIAPDFTYTINEMGKKDSVPLFSSAWQIDNNVMLSASDLNRKKPVAVIVDSKNAFAFHYRFARDTLTLYGPFMRSMLFYENAGSRLVMRYLNNYYPLPPVTAITPLKEGPVLGVNRVMK